MSTYERLVNSQNFFSPYLTQEDMSRFGRDYIEASNYIETIFPFLGVRFISVSDHFDTEAEFNQNKALEIALKNLVNDMYAKDISKRVSVSRRLDMERGKFTGSNAPYGYKVDSGDALRKYVIDRDAAAVVRQIFELAADGVTLREIAKALQEYRLALPGDYLKTGNLYVEEGAEAKAWYPGTISNILKNQAYIGNMVRGKGVPACMITRQGMLRMKMIGLWLKIHMKRLWIRNYSIG